MNAIIDLIGKRFGRLTVISKIAVPVGNKLLWSCNCDCGQIKNVKGSDLRSGDTKSCGCLRTERMTTHGQSAIKKTAEYNSWAGLKDRCNNPNSPAFAHYGGRGITVCPEWNTFEQFFADMGLKPTPQHSIDRIDNNKGYSKENCRWATRVEQGRNKRGNTKIKYRGIVFDTLTELTEYYGLPYKQFWELLQKGFTVSKVIKHLRRNIQTI